jgi:hypothetical protein
MESLYYVHHWQLEAAVQADRSSAWQEAEMGVIPAAIGTLSRYYPRRDVKDPTLYQYVDQVMTGLPGTPCCVQMSHALNMSGIKIPSHSYRRPNVKLTIDGTDYYYLLATDELEKCLVSCCGDDGEAIDKDLGKTRSVGDVKAYISNRPGLLLFRHAGLGVPPPKHKFEHTELWDGTKTLQRDAAESLFACPRVLIWDTNDPAQWLVDYMKGQP